LRTLRERYPTQVDLSIVHYPLNGHAFAEPAARAAECAGEQGRFEPMHNSLFVGSRQLRLKPWREFAAEAGVADLAAFESCVESKSPVPRIVDGAKLADDLGVRGTPTLIVNGWMLGQPPTAQKLDQMVRAVLAGKKPI
jgi:protein-disulfide isomerase